MGDKLSPHQSVLRQTYIVTNIILEGIVLFIIFVIIIVDYFIKYSRSDDRVKVEIMSVLMYLSQK